MNNKPKTTTLLGININRKEPAARGKVNRTTSVRKTRSSSEFDDILSKTLVDFTADSNEEKRENPSSQAIHREFDLTNATTTTESTSATASNQDESDDIPRPHKTVESFPSNTDGFESIDTRQIPPSRNAIRSVKPILKSRLAKVATIRGLGESKQADSARHITWQEENTDANFSSDEPATSSEASDTSSERQSSDDVEDIFSGINLNFMDELKHEVQDSQIFRDLHREFDMAPANTSTIENVLKSAKVDLANKNAGIKPKVTPRRMTLQDAIKTGHVQTKQKIDQVQNAKPVRPTNIRTVEPQTKLVQERKAMAKAKLDQKCASLATSKTKLPPLVVAKNEEIAQLNAQLAEVKADLMEAKYDLVVHAQTEKHLRELNDERLQEIDTLTQLLSQERAELDNQREENCHLTQCVEELKEQNHNQRNYQIKYETIVVEFEEARRHWSATQTTLEDRLGYDKRQLATAQRRLGSAIHEKLECEVQIRCLQNILHQTVQEKDDSPVSTVTYPMEDHTRELNEYSQISDRLANEERNLEMTVENHKAEKIRDCQIINQLHVTVHESSNEYKQLLVTHEDTINEWNASQMASEDQLSRAHEQLERLNQQLVDALVAKHQQDYEIESLRSILHRFVQEREVSKMNTLVFQPEMIASSQHNQQARRLVIQSKSEWVNEEHPLRENQENPQLASELATVQSELTKITHELRIHEQNECDLWGEMYGYYQIFNRLANENRNLQTTVENLTAEVARDSQIVRGLDFGVQSGSQTQIKAMQEMIYQILEENEVLHNENKTSDKLQQALQAQLREVNSRNDYLLIQCDEHESKIEDLESKLHEVQRAKTIWVCVQHDDGATTINQTTHAQDPETMTQFQREGDTNDKLDGEDQMPEAIIFVPRCTAMAQDDNDAVGAFTNPVSDASNISSLDPSAKKETLLEQNLRLEDQVKNLTLLCTDIVERCQKNESHVAYLEFQIKQLQHTSVGNIDHKVNGSQAQSKSLHQNIPKYDQACNVDEVKRLQAPVITSQERDISHPLEMETHTQPSTHDEELKDANCHVGEMKKTTRNQDEVTEDRPLASNMVASIKDIQITPTVPTPSQAHLRLSRSYRAPISPNEMKKINRRLHNTLPEVVAKNQQNELRRQQKEQIQRRIEARQVRRDQHGNVIPNFALKRKK
ncbi:hypothetical protein AC1031_013247 [Aphanomyces cochlioides]|nr:hypothetical protein AC1031_013247 [Aphanomyces cochlioides]